MHAGEEPGLVGSTAQGSVSQALFKTKYTAALSSVARLDSSSGIPTTPAAWFYSELLVGTQNLIAFTCRTYALWQSLQR
jgi:hypothetical protein